MSRPCCSGSTGHPAARLRWAKSSVLSGCFLGAFREAATSPAPPGLGAIPSSFPGSWGMSGLYRSSSAGLYGGVVGGVRPEPPRTKGRSQLCPPLSCPILPQHLGCTRYRMGGGCSAPAASSIHRHREKKRDPLSQQVPEDSPFPSSSCRGPLNSIPPKTHPLSCLQCSHAEAAHGKSRVLAVQMGSRARERICLLGWAQLELVTPG